MKFINLFKNRTVLGITCIVLALIICFVVSPLISRTSNKTVSVVLATVDIKSGDEITKDSCIFGNERKKLQGCYRRI